MTELIDIHCHGALGHEFGADVKASRAAAGYHRSQGVSQLVASLVSGTAETMEHSVRVLAPLVADGTLLGIHLEGPFLSDGRRGAHDPTALRDADRALIEQLAAVAEHAGAPNALRQMTFAPERGDTRGLIGVLVAHGITPAIGHTDADAATVTAAIDHVVERSGHPALITQLFNGMPPMHHRAGGPVAVALAAAGRGDVFVELIADGVHVAPEVVRMVFETLGPEAIVLVSDSMAATGLSDGPYRIGTLDVRVEGGTARLVQGGSIAGSTSTLADCVRWAIDVAGLPEADVLTAASVTPRRALRL